MNLEQLISKYIDGELSHEGDLRLRRLLNEDAEAREVFDSSLDIHLAAKEDAQSINPSDEIVRKTEDLVLMRIMSQAQAKAAPLKQRASKSRAAGIRRPALALAVSLLLLFTAYNIYDQNDYISSGNGSAALNSDNTEDNNIFNEQSVYAESVTETSEIANNEANTIANNKANSLVNNDVNTLESLETAGKVSNQNRQLPVANDIARAILPDQITETNSGHQKAYVINKVNKEAKLSDNDIAAADAITEISPEKKGSVRIGSPAAFNPPADRGNAHALQKTSALSAGIEPALTGYGSTLMMNEFYEVKLTTTVANSIFHRGINTSDGSNIMHYSQSIAFTPDRVSSYGFEFGYTEFQYNEEAVVKLPAGNSFSQLEELDPSSTEYIETMMIMKTDNRIFWGTAFYERVFLDTDYLKFSGKLGLGASRDGGLAITRFAGHYELMNNFYLNFGAEGRLFMAKVPRLSSGRSDWNSTISLIYGIQLNF
ncbi:MAG: hypothetical protein ACLFR2_01550 [Candidatus Kapaibacterium sp.]